MLDGQIKPLPKSVIYVGKQGIGCALSHDRYEQHSPYIMYAYLRKIMSVEDSPNQYIDIAEKYALIYCECQTFTQSLFNDLQLEVYVFADIKSGDGISSLKIDRYTDTIIFNPNCFSVDYYSGDKIDITVPYTKEESILRGSPWGLDNIMLQGPYRVEITITYRDGLSDIFIAGDTV